MERHKQRTPESGRWRLRANHAGTKAEFHQRKAKRLVQTRGRWPRSFVRGPALLMPTGEDPRIVLAGKLLYGYIR